MATGSMSLSPERRLFGSTLPTTNRQVDPPSCIYTEPIPIDAIGCAGDWPRLSRTATARGQAILALLKRNVQQGRSRLASLNSTPATWSQRIVGLRSVGVSQMVTEHKDPPPSGAHCCTNRSLRIASGACDGGAVFNYQGLAQHGNRCGHMV
jgi:hypothetical protein